MRIKQFYRNPGPPILQFPALAVNMIANLLGVGGVGRRPLVPEEQ